MKTKNKVHITTDHLSPFYQLLALGIRETAVQGTTIHDYLTSGIGVNADYAARRIQTIFLNGRAVDDIRQSALNRDDTLALSAAMPGLVGATFRRSGFYSNLRKEISHTRLDRSTANRMIPFTLKLFNIIAAELGPLLFQKGVVVNGNRFRDFIASLINQGVGFTGGIRLDRRKIDMDDLAARAFDGHDIHLTISPP